MDDRSGAGITTVGDFIRQPVSTPVDVAVDVNHEVKKEFCGEAEADLVQPKAVPLSTAAAALPQTELSSQPAPSSSDETQLQAVFVKDTFADGTQLPPNTVFQQTWTMYNPGPLAWPEGSSVRFVGGDSMFNVDTNRPCKVGCITSASESNRLPASVEPGQSAAFTVTMKSPSREGTAISYWRLKLPNGMPFGHRLWCEVQVRAGAELPCEKQIGISDLVAAPEEEAQLSKTEEAAVAAAVAELLTSASTATATAQTQHAPPDEPECSNSKMIFPTLDKESPAMSVHEATAEPAAASAVPLLPHNVSEDLIEEVESLVLEDVDTDDDGFVTDEEYDVLDASDQEFLEAQQQQD